MTTTRRGRVVYNRRTHLFRYRDVNRIVRVVEPVSIAEAPDVYFTFLRALEDLTGLGKDVVRGVARRGLFAGMPLEVILTLVQLLIGILASLGEEATAWVRKHGADLVAELLAWFGGFFGTAVPEPLPGEAIVVRRTT